MLKVLFGTFLPNVNVNSYELKLVFYITNNTEIGIQSKRFITVQRVVRTRIDNFFWGEDFKNWQNWFLLRNWKKLLKWVAQYHIYKQRCESCRFLHSQKRTKKTECRTKISKMLENIPGRVKFFSSTSHGGHDPSECVRQTTMDSDFALKSIFS